MTNKRKLKNEKVHSYKFSMATALIKVVLVIVFSVFVGVKTCCATNLVVKAFNGSDTEIRTNHTTVSEPVYREQWTSYTSGNTNGGIANNNIRGITFEPGGIAWIGTNGGGLTRFNGTTWAVYKTAQGLVSNYVGGLEIDQQGNLWVATDGGVSRFNGSSFTNYTTSNSGLPNNSTRKIAVDWDGTTVWITTEGSGVCKFTGVSWTIYNATNSALPNNVALGIAIDSQGNKWFATMRGAAKFDGSSWSVYISQLPGNEVYDVTIDSAGNVWFATPKGVSKFNGSTWTTYEEENGMPKEDSRVIYADNNDVVWVGTYGSGLCKFKSGSWTQYTTANSDLLNNCIWSVKKQSPEKIWIGSNGGVNITGLADASAAPASSQISGSALLAKAFTDTSANEIESGSENLSDNNTTDTNSIAAILLVPGRAGNPSPANGAIGVNVTADLSWKTGTNAASHDVYFGTDPKPGPNQFRGNQTRTVFVPAALNYETKYYWRVNEKNGVGLIYGVVWSFMTAPSPPVQASNPGPANKATNVGTNADLRWTPGSNAISHNLYFGTANPGTFIGNFTQPKYDLGTLQTATTYYWRIDEVGRGGTTTGAVWRFTTVPPLPGQAANPNPLNGATNVSRTVKLQWSAGACATSHSVYFGTNPAPGADEFKGNQTSLTFETGVLDYETTYYWRVDEKNFTGTTAGVVWSFTTKSLASPTKASVPRPSNGATGVNVNTHLHWMAGEDAASHDVYFGTNPTPGPNEFKGNVTSTKFDPGTLTELTTYYWRIDEKNKLATTTDDVLSFTTGRRLMPRPAGSIVSWGDDNFGNVSGKPPGDDFVAVACGHSHSLALRADGTVAAWGRDVYGSGSVPPELNSKIIVDISVGYAHNLVLFDDGTVSNWGARDKPAPELEPMWPVPPELDGEAIVAIAAGSNHDLVLKDDGSLFCWGYDSQGQVSKTPSGNDFVAVATGNYHCLALKADGTVVAWGYDNYNQCKVPQEVHGAIAIDAGSYCSMALKPDGTIVVWGVNNWMPSPNANFIAVAAGGYGKAALRSDGTLASWASEDGVPSPVTPTDTGYVAISAGYAHWLAIKSLSTEPRRAINPKPISGATNVKTTGLILGWMPGLNAACHNVYFGTNPIPGTADFKGEQTGTIFNPGVLSCDTTYYWRIDEINKTSTTSGDIWSFTTEASILP